MRRILACFAVFALWMGCPLSAVDLFWWPPTAADTDANVVTNWSTSGSVRVENTGPITGANLNLSGSGAGVADCTFSADTSVGGISGDASFALRTFSDGGRTLTLSGGFFLTSGSLNLSGVLDFQVPAASIVSIGTPTGGNLHVVTANIPATSSISMQTDLSTAGLTLTGNGAWNWNNQRTLTVRGSSTVSVASTVSFTNTRAMPLRATLICQDFGSTLRLNPLTSQPDLQVAGSTDLGTITGNPLVLTTTEDVALGTGATITLSADLVLQGDSTLTQGVNSLIDGSGSFVWRQDTHDFPASAGTTLDCPVTIQQLASATPMTVALPAWSFGSSLTFLATNDLAAGSDLIVNVNGAVSATDISCSTLVANAEVRLIFNASGAAFTASGTMSVGGSCLGVWQANGFPIVCTANGFDITSAGSNLSMEWTTESANLTLDVFGNFHNASASDIVTLNLTGPGDGSQNIDLGAAGFTSRIDKTGTAQNITLTQDLRIDQLTVQDSSNLVIDGGGVHLVYVNGGSVITLADTGSINGDLTFAADVVGPSSGAITVDNQTGDARIDFARQIYGEAGTFDIDVTGGLVSVSGDDNRTGGTPSRTIISGSGSIVEYIGTAADIDVIANAGSTLRGTATLKSYDSGASEDTFIEPGVNLIATFNTGTTDLTPASAGVTVQVNLQVSGNSTPGGDYDQLNTTALTLNTETTFDIDLSGWSGTGRVDGIVTYTSLAGDPSTAILNLRNAGGYTAVLVDDPANQQIDLDISAVVSTGIHSLRGPAIPLSTRRSTIWVGVCPGTPEGLTRLRNLISSHDPNKVAAYIWDPSTQAYVQYPAEPVGGLQTWHGWFIATRVNLNLDFTGTFSSSPYSQNLTQGWNFIGFGPTDDGTAQQRNYTWTGVILDDGGGAVSEPTRTTIIGSSTFVWQTNRYVARDGFKGGEAQWVYCSLPAHSLTDGGVIDVDVDATFTSTVATKSVAPPPTIPPPPAAFGPPVEEADDSGGGCGGGSAIGLLLALLALAWRRRGSL